MQIAQNRTKTAAGAHKEDAQTHAEEGLVDPALLDPVHKFGIYNNT